MLIFRSSIGSRFPSSRITSLIALLAVCVLIITVNLQIFPPLMSGSLLFSQLASEIKKVPCQSSRICKQVQKSAWTHLPTVSGNPGYIMLFKPEIPKHRSSFIGTASTRHRHDDSGRRHASKAILAAEAGCCKSVSDEHLQHVCTVWSLLQSLPFCWWLLSTLLGCQNLQRLRRRRVIKGQNMMQRKELAGWRVLAVLEAGLCLRRLCLDSVQAAVQELVLKNMSGAVKFRTGQSDQISGF